MNANVRYKGKRGDHSVSVRKNLVSAKLPSDGSPHSEVFEIFPLPMPGDFDMSGSTDGRDIDLLSSAVRDGQGLFFVFGQLV